MHACTAQFVHAVHVRCDAATLRLRPARPSVRPSDRRNLDSLSSKKSAARIWLDGTGNTDILLYFRVLLGQFQVRARARLVGGMGILMNHRA